MPRPHLTPEQRERIEQAFRDIWDIILASGAYRFTFPRDEPSTAVAVVSPTR
jgi:hypothetical protein